MSEPSVGRPWVCAAALVLPMLVLQAGGASVGELLAYQRQGLMQGELWRVFSGHFVHLGWNHALLNCAGLLFCCGLAPQRFRPLRLAGDLLLLNAAVSLGLFWLSPGIGWYVGLSGVLYGLFVLGLVPLAVRGDRIALGGLLAILGWMAWQLLVGPAAAEEKQIGGRIVVFAHLYGLAGAALVLLVEQGFSQLRRQARHCERQAQRPSVGPGLRSPSVLPGNRRVP